MTCRVVFIILGLFYFKDSFDESQLVHIENVMIILSYLYGNHFY